jgi:hypothetical protein
MTRTLTSREPLYSVGVVRNIVYPPAFLSSGSGSNASTSSGDRMAVLLSGTANNGWGRATIARGVNSGPTTGGTGIRFGKRIGVSFNLIVAYSSFTNVNNIVRILVGSNQTPQPDGNDPVSYRSFGLEFKARGSSHDWRIFAHNGSAITYSAWANTGLQASLLITPLMLAVESDGVGNITAFLGFDCSRTLTSISGTGGPTTNGSTGQEYLDIHVVNSASGTSSLTVNVFDAKIYTE